MNILILGAGIAGTSLAIPLHANGHQVTIAGNFMEQEKLASMQDTRQHPSPQFPIPDGIQLTHWKEAQQQFATYTHLIIAVSSAGLSWAMNELSPYLQTHPIPYLLVAKGVHSAEDHAIRPLLDATVTHLSPVLPDIAKWGSSLAGPMLCQELALQIPTAIVITSYHAPVAKSFQLALQTDALHVKTTTDVIGVSWCAALKNIYALGLGIYSGMQETAEEHTLNSRAALFGQSLREMTAIVMAMGGQPDSVFDLAGAGDLYVTEHGGRNAKFGRIFGRGATLAEATEIFPSNTVESLKLLTAYGIQLESMMANQTLPNLPFLHWIIQLICHEKPLSINWHLLFSNE